MAASDLLKDFSPHTLCDAVWPCASMQSRDAPIIGGVRGPIYVAAQVVPVQHTRKSEKPVTIDGIGAEAYPFVVRLSSVRLVLAGPDGLLPFSAKFGVTHSLLLGAGSIPETALANLPLLRTDATSRAPMVLDDLLDERDEETETTGVLACKARRSLNALAALRLVQNRRGKHVSLCGI